MSVIVKPMKETFNGRIATLRWSYYIFFAMKSQVKNIISAGGFPPALRKFMFSIIPHDTQGSFPAR